jgi:hypothetical protein
VTPVIPPVLMEKLGASKALEEEATPEVMKEASFLDHEPEVAENTSSTAIAEPVQSAEGLSIAEPVAQIEDAATQPGLSALEEKPELVLAEPMPPPVIEAATEIEPETETVNFAPSIESEPAQVTAADSVMAREELAALENAASQRESHLEAQLVREPEPEAGPEPRAEPSVKAVPEPHVEEVPLLEAQVSQPGPPVAPPPPILNPIQSPSVQPRVLEMPERRVGTTATPTQPRLQGAPPIHPSPDSLPITSPPPSAGMPTFQEVVDAAGAPQISPFEQLGQKSPHEDEDLKQFVANFRYSPPSETADELTMRSEAPVIDKEAPAEFHHPSFDEDVPPPEAEPHPTGHEYYAPDGTTKPSSRFLDVGEVTKEAPKRAATGGASLLGLEDAGPVIPPAAAHRPSRVPGWLWGSLLVLLAGFGALGFWKGRVQNMHAFRGPVEFARVEAHKLRQKIEEELARRKEPSHDAENATTQTSAPAAEPAKQEQPPQVGGSQTDASGQTAPPVNTPATDTQSLVASTSDGQAKPATAASATQTPPAPDATVETAASETPARLEPPPPPKPSSKPQPGQQELAKAMQASDASAEAAWLWKATSRGNPEAPVRLAEMYIKGNGVPRSCEQALVLLRSAATKENAPARNRLAALYANGTCVVRDRVKAYELLTTALVADPNSEWAKENREALWNQMTPPERAMAQKYR